MIDDKTRAAVYRELADDIEGEGFLGAGNLRSMAEGLDPQITDPYPGDYHEGFNEGWNAAKADPEEPPIKMDTLKYIADTIIGLTNTGHIVSAKIREAEARAREMGEYD